MTKTPSSINQRDALTMAAAWVAALPTSQLTGNQFSAANGDDLPDATAGQDRIDSKKEKEESVNVHYLEIVTKDVDASCALFSKIHGVTFGDADKSLGGARTTKMPDGGMMGIRAPMHDGERPVTRAYILVNDIETAVAAAKEAGAEIAVPSMKIPGHGTIAIYFLGGIEAGLWQI